MVAPGTTAPLTSVTVPAMRPLSVCAFAVSGNTNSTARAMTTSEIRPRLWGTALYITILLGIQKYCGIFDSKNIHIFQTKSRELILKLLAFTIELRRTDSRRAKLRCCELRLKCLLT